MLVFCSMLLSVLWCTDRGGSISHAQDVLESSKTLNQNGYGCAYVCTCEGVCIVCHTCAYFVYICINTFTTIHIYIYVNARYIFSIYIERERERVRDKGGVIERKRD